MCFMINRCPLFYAYEYFSFAREDIVTEGSVRIEINDREAEYWKNAIDLLYDGEQAIPAPRDTAGTQG
ncbi:MAG: hypothetical protein BWY80_01351 [Firmicutes bacterium ADurb.Bin456]|nr:MAG: hypothetical protein BWY80_01351 [Firmicutes bacterium ADurb.Bin456]